MVLSGGPIRQLIRNNKMGTDLNIWVKGNMVIDSGLTVAPEARIEKSDSTRHYIKLSDDWGTLILGNHHSPAVTMSLSADWRGSISTILAPKVTQRDGAASAKMITASPYGVTGHADTKVIYTTPDISGFKVGVSMADAGEISTGDSTEYALQYSMAGFGGGTLKFGYTGASQKAANGLDASGKTKVNEMGVSATSGPFLVSLVQATKKVTPNKGMVTQDDKGQELEVAYDVTDSLKLNMVYFSAKARKGANKDDTFKSTSFGAKYTIAPGLYTSLGYKSFSYKDKDNGKLGDNKGSGMRLRVHASF